MSFDDNELRRALEARSGEASPEYRARVRHAVSGLPAGAKTNWLAAIAIVVVTLLTATSITVLVASRRAGHVTTASGAPVATPTPPGELPAGPNINVSAVSQDVVWALVDNAHLYRSTDRGGHWESRPLPPELGIKPSIAFVNATEGWLLAPGSPTTQCQEAHADVWHTTNAGATWTRVRASGIDDAQCKELIYFASPKLGFVTAWDANHRPTVYSTLDGGASWLKSTLPDGPLFVTSQGGFVLRVGWIRSFGSTVYLEASGPQDDRTWPLRAFILTSHDGGATWSWKQKVASRYTFMVTESRWLQLAPDKADTVNGGQAFGPFTSDLRGVSPSVVFAGAELGYATADGALQRTADGGAHWMVVAIPGGAPLPSPSASPTVVPMPSDVQLSAPSTNVVWALVANSLLYVSTDRGDTWQQRILPNQFTGGGAIEISFVDASSGWLTTCTATTTLWRTTDGARSWQMLPAAPGETSGCVQGLSFVDAGHGFASRNDTTDPPAVYRTADSGLTWHGSLLPDPPGFHSSNGFTLNAHGVVVFGSVDYLTAYGLQPDGGKAYVFRSTDGGASWVYTAAVPNTAVSVAFITASRWLQVISPGESLETTDSGKSWHPYASDYSQAAPVTPQVVFGDASVGYATVRGEIQRMQDGGALWTRIKTTGT